MFILYISCQWRTPSVYVGFQIKYSIFCIFIKGQSLLMGLMIHSPVIWLIWLLLLNLIKGIKYLLTIIDIFNKYAWAVPVKDKTWASPFLICSVFFVSKGNLFDIYSITKIFEKVMINNKRKPEKHWVDEGREFYNIEFKKPREKWYFNVPCI